MSALSRRKMIELSAFGLLGLKLGCAPEAQPPTQPSAAQATSKQLNTVETLTARGLGADRKALDAAQRTGAEWLKTQTPSPSARVLFDALFREVPQQPDAYTKWIIDRHRSDIEANRMELVAGWSISQTEAHVFALLALTKPQP